MTSPAPATSLRLRIEVTRLDPVTTKKRTVAVIAGDQVSWHGDVDDAGRSNLLPQFAELTVLDIALSDGDEVRQLLTVVGAPKGDGQTITAVIDAVTNLVSGAAVIAAPGVGMLAAGGARLGAQALKNALAPRDAQHVMGTVYIEARCAGDSLRLQMCAGHEDYPLLRVDSDGNRLDAGDPNGFEVDLERGNELLLLTACHEYDDCRMNTYFRVMVE